MSLVQHTLCWFFHRAKLKNPMLKLVNKVINNNGGLAEAGQWTLYSKVPALNDKNKSQTSGDSTQGKYMLYMPECNTN